MKTILTLMVALLPLTVQAKPNTKVDCNVHKIFCDILTVKPSINRSYAMELSNYIYKWSRYYGTDPKLSVAIAMQENKLVNGNRMGMVLNKYKKKVPGPTDIGVFQLHVATLDKMERKLGWKVDYNRLESDLDHQTELHVRWLRRRMRICRKPYYVKKLNIKKKTEWACYHSYTPYFRKKYIRDVGKYLKKIRVEGTHTYLNVK